VFHFNKIDRPSRVRGKGRDVERASGSSDLPLDHQLTFSPAPDERWTYEEGRGLMLNGESVKEMVRDSGGDVRTLCGLSQGLSEYQQFVWGRGGKDRANFNGQVHALQDVIMGRLGSLYDGLTGGVHFEWRGDEFWVNNVNIRSVIKLYMSRPTETSRRYLEGLKQKLSLILSKQHSSTKYDAVQGEAGRLFNEISMVLQCVPATSVPRLCA
jgi:hypothetical protein